MERTFYGVHDRSLTLNNRNSYDSFQTQIRTNGGYFIGCGFAALNNRRRSLEEQKKSKWLLLVAVVDRIGISRILARPARCWAWKQILLL
jgi:hypothetical protein